MSIASRIKQKNSREFADSTTTNALEDATKRSSELVFDEKYLRSSALKLAQQGQYRKAIAVFSQLIDYDSNNAIDFNNRGLIYFQIGEKEKAFCVRIQVAEY